ncbi:response regulator [uncultured Hyphomonas sp.]|jgi:CheY-like chemotaxis protein/DNA-directed RNA polymerase specialized sigma24 family protein|uniref:PhyR family response regulator anti-anti-sigma factor n=1 Tax=uncultured Hyphomonas sp. TaxID=225298 RepID=UPI000C40F1E1|nr:response regulator [Hyphomonadaceae bacterium]|tara:strand:+ start:209387 stop:210163 length:777 start_codon:yes stop_codon:yes gene_type:complete
MLSDLISSELPYLRRYARGLMGEQQNGDEAVEDMIESLIFRISVAPDLKFQKADLFAELDKSISKRVSTLTDETGIAKILNAMTTLQRRSLLLTVVEGFSVQEAARILSVGVPDVEEMLRTAESAIANEVSTSVLIIEDESMISYQLSQIVTEAGHKVVGVATTQTEAVQLAGESEFGLILSDLRLADGSVGIDAVKEIFSKLNREVPVIYITAYPEMLLQGQDDEPSYLIPKPFEPLHVRTVVDQAILSAFLGQEAA